MLAIRFVFYKMCICCVDKVNSIIIIIIIFFISCSNRVIYRQFGVMLLLCDILFLFQYIVKSALKRSYSYYTTNIYKSQMITCIISIMYVFSLVL